MATETVNPIVVLQRGTSSIKLKKGVVSGSDRTLAGRGAGKSAFNKKDYNSGSLPGCRFCGTEDEVETAVNMAGRADWVSFDKKLTIKFLNTAIAKPNFKQVEHFVQMSPASPETLFSLYRVARQVIDAHKNRTWLPRAEMFAVLKAPASERHDVFLGGSADSDSETVALVRGNLETVTVPFSFFRPAGDGEKADFTQLGFTDYGHTIAFGDYEAAADCVLYELDPEFRLRVKRQRQAEDNTFGACLRRLRKQRGLERTAFPGITAKTVARIERNEIGKPHGRTLQILAKRLGVLADEIESF